MSDATPRLASIADARALLRDLSAPTDLPADAPVEVLDIGANPIDGDPPYLPLLRAGLARVTGFEPQPDALERLREAAGPHERYLPYALGDGGEHELRVCAESGFSSLLEPDADRLALLTDFPRLATVVERLPVRTRRLDDVARSGRPDEAIERVDLLKIDIQGSELAVIEHGRATLDGLLAVQIEVNHHRLYAGQPSAADVDAVMRDLGLVPHRVVAAKTWPLAPTQWADPDVADAHTMVEADVLYVRDIARLPEFDDRSLLALARIAGIAYGSLGLARACLEQLVRRGSVTPG